MHAVETLCRVTAMSCLLSDSPDTERRLRMGEPEMKTLNPNTATGHGSNENRECHSLRPDSNLIKKHIPGHHPGDNRQNYILLTRKYTGVSAKS